MKKIKDKFFFFLGGRDLEMVEIKNVLKANEISFADNGLGWGAKASAYIDLLGATGELTPVLVELELDCEVPEGTVAIDHHGARSGEPASILQVLNLLGLEPTRHQSLVAANDAGFIPAMLAIGATADEIDTIRSADRAAQGITPEQETEAERAIASAEKHPNGLMVVRMAHSKCATVTDRLFTSWPEGREKLLVLASDGESDFYGDGALCAELKDKFEGSWAGGSGLGQVGGQAYWGGYAPQNEVESFVLANNISD